MLKGVCSFEGVAGELTVWRTETFAERSKGLLALPPLDAEQGLLLEPCMSVHTFGMPYALDLVYLDRAMAVVKVVAQVVPGRMSACWRARFTLELPAGTAATLELTPGMQMHWRSITDDAITNE